MNKNLKIVFILLFMLMFTKISAQFGNFRFGLQSGALYTKAIPTYKYKDASSLEYQTTYSYNLYANYSFNDKWSLSVEPGYLQQTDHNNATLDYMQFPVLFEAQVINGLYVTAGPEINVLLNTYNTNYKRIDPGFQLGCYIREMNNFDMGVKVGRSMEGFLKTNVFSDGYGFTNFNHLYFQIITRYVF